MSNKTDVTSCPSLRPSARASGFSKTERETVNDSALIRAYLIPENGVLFVTTDGEGISLEAQVHRCIVVPHIRHVLQNRRSIRLINYAKQSRLSRLADSLWKHEIQEQPKDQSQHATYSYKRQRQTFLRAKINDSLSTFLPKLNWHQSKSYTTSWLCRRCINMTLI